MPPCQVLIENKVKYVGLLQQLPPVYWFTPTKFITVLFLPLFLM